MGTPKSTEKSAVTMLCPNLGCGRTISAPPETRGKVVRCPYCNGAFRVPSEAPANVVEVDPGEAAARRS